MAPRIRQPLLIVTAFWVYVAASNVLYANSMQANLSALHVAHFFAGWQARLLQHVFLYPELLACVWASLRIGWQPLGRRLPLQALMAVAFAMSANPILGLGEMFAGARLPQLLFLDIQMDSLDGVSLARALDPQTLPLIVFVTAYDQYALDAFDVSAVDYLLKPFDDQHFQRTIERVRRRQVAQTSTQRQDALGTVLERIARGLASVNVRPRVLAELGSRMHMLDVAQIELAEADRNYVKLTIGRDTFHARSTLQEAEKTLQSQPMLRISRSCLVNVNHVREVSRTPRGDFILVLAGGTTVTSSEGFRDAVRQHLDRLKVRPG